MGRHFEVRAASMAKTAAAKAKVYSKHSKEIFMAAKNGVPDPEMNSALKQCIDKAKANQVPAHVIKNAIDKAKGGSTDNYNAATYEVYGKGGATFIVECMTDNPNRTISAMNTAMNKSKFSLGKPGSVSFNYENCGLLQFAFDDEDALLEALLMAEVDVKEVDIEDGQAQVTIEPSDLYKAKAAVDEIIPDCTYDTLEIRMIPNEFVTLDEESLELAQRFLDNLEEAEDVDNVYHNVENL